MGVAAILPVSMIPASSSAADSDSAAASAVRAPVHARFRDLKLVFTSRGTIEVMANKEELQQPSGRTRMVVEGFHAKDNEEALRVCGWARRQDGTIGLFTSASVEAVELKDGTRIHNFQRPKGKAPAIIRAVKGTVVPTQA